MIKAVSRTTPVLCLETRLFHSREGIPTTDLVQSISLCLFPICLVIKVLRKLSSAQTGKMLLVTPTWQSQTLHQLLLKVSIVFPYNQSKIYLSHMLVILMTLTSASRDSQMYCLDVWLMVKSEATSIFALHKLHKNLRKDKAPPSFL